MTALALTSLSSSASDLTVATRSVDAVSRLAGWPCVQQELVGRGVEVTRAADETTDEYENRMGTSLMALFRDTRQPESFEALYAFARGAVQQWIRGLLHRGQSHLDPAELLQDTFVNVYRYPTAFRADHAGSFRVWVRTIAGNLVRRAGAPRSRMFFQELPDGINEPVDAREGPVSQVAAVEQQRRLQGAYLLFLGHYSRAWSELGERDRKTLELVEVQGLSYEEAGRVLNVGRSNMKMIVFRARKRIARRMRQAMNASVFAPRQALRQAI